MTQAGGKARAGGVRDLAASPPAAAELLEAKLSLNTNPPLPHAMGPARSCTSCSSKRLLETNLLHPRSRKRAWLSHLRHTMRDIRRHQRGLEPGNFGCGYRGRLRSPCATPHRWRGTGHPCPVPAGRLHARVLVAPRRSPRKVQSQSRVYCFYPVYFMYSFTLYYML